MISIIIPIYNVESYLPRCIDALLSQSFQDFELILVDDGSPDHCGEICEQYAVKDTRIKVLHKQNGGLSDARNAGLRVASGEYIAFVDSDDWVAADFLKLLYETMQKTGADIVECNVLKTSDETVLQAAPSSAETEAAASDVSAPGSAVSCYNTEQALRELICDGIFRQTVWNKLYRRACLKNIFFEVGKTNEDEFWTYQVFGRAKQIVKVDLALYYYFQRPGSIMQTSYSVKRLDALEAKAARQKYIEEQFPALGPLAKRNLVASCIYAGQMSLKNLQGDARETAAQRISTYADAFRLAGSDFAGTGLKESLWLRLAKISFWGTVKVKNLLGKGV